MRSATGGCVHNPEPKSGQSVWICTLYSIRQSATARLEVWVVALASRAPRRCGMLIGAAPHSEGPRMVPPRRPVSGCASRDRGRRFCQGLGADCASISWTLPLEGQARMRPRSEGLSSLQEECVCLASYRPFRCRTPSDQSISGGIVNLNRIKSSGA